MTRTYNVVKDSPDARDHHYTNHLGVENALQVAPIQADLRPMCAPVFDQGDTNSCTGNAIVGAMEYDEKVQNEAFENYSRLFVYYNERVIENDVNQDEGAEIRDGIKAIAQYGVCEENLWPFEQSHVLLKPSLEAYSDGLKHKALSYARVPQTHDALLHCLGVDKKPVVFGIQVYESFETEEVEKSGMVPMPQAGEKLMGGHAILIVGYDAIKQLFLIRNSWGPTWGLGGYAWVPFAYILNENLADDFWVVGQIE